MTNAIEKSKLLNHVIKKSKENPLDIFELNDGRIVVNGNVFPNRKEFDKILEVARINNELPRGRAIEVSNRNSLFYFDAEHRGIKPEK